MKDSGILLANVLPISHIGFAKNEALCKARLTTNLRIVVKPCQIADINSSHSHGPDTTRFEIVQSISQMKDQATNSEDSTRSISAGEQLVTPVSLRYQDLIL